VAARIRAASGAEEREHPPKREVRGRGEVALGGVEGDEGLRVLALGQGAAGVGPGVRGGRDGRRDGREAARGELLELDAGPRVAVRRAAEGIGAQELELGGTDERGGDQAPGLSGGGVVDGEGEAQLARHGALAELEGEAGAGPQRDGEGGIGGDEADEHPGGGRVVGAAAIDGDLERGGGGIVGTQAQGEAAAEADVDEGELDAEHEVGADVQGQREHGVGPDQVREQHAADPVVAEEDRVRELEGGVERAIEAILALAGKPLDVGA